MDRTVKKLSMSITEYYKRKIYHSGSEPVPATAVLSFYNGTTLLETQTITDGGDGSYSGSTPTKAQDAQYTYAFSGWSKDADDNTVDADALTNVVADRSVYACFTATLRKYTVLFVRASADGGGTLQTISDVNYGTTITAATAYTGATPTTTQGDYPFDGWEPASATVHGDTTFTAKFETPVDVSEITDSWDTIIANIDNGTYSTAYKIGQYKPLAISSSYAGESSIINMQIVAMDADELESGGVAPLTFISRECTYNSVSIGENDWEATSLRNTTLNSVIYRNIRTLNGDLLADRIQSVKKIQLGGSGQETTTFDKLWLPSKYEVQGYGESSGVRYDKIYPDNSSRRKVRASGTTHSAWWLRSRASSSQYYDVSSQGAVQQESSTYKRAFAFGFCLGLAAE